MNNGILRILSAPRAIAAAMCLIFAACLPAPLLAQKAKYADDSKLFGLDVLHQIHFELSASNYVAMQPPAKQGVGSWLARLQTVKDSHRNGFNEFPWVHATVTIDGRAYTNIAVRYKGNFTYGATKSLLKRSMKIDLGHYEQPDRFGSLKKITLNAGILDPRRMREALAYAAFREAGVPAPRTAFAEVTLTVPGQYDHELLGLYTLVEDVEGPFLKKHFGDSKGLLMKPEGVRGPDYFGEEWQAYPASYHPGRDASPDEATRLLTLARLIEKGDDAAFKKQIGEYLDVEEFLRYLAVSALTVHLDSPLAMGQNYFMYLPAGTKKLVFLPWDLDLTFASWPLGGPAEEQMKMSVLHPHTGKHKLIERLLADKETRARYLQIIKDLAATSFTEKELLNKITIMEKALKDALERETKALTARNENAPTREAMRTTAAAPSLREFVTKRLASIQKQLKEAGLD